MKSYSIVRIGDDYVVRAGDKNVLRSQAGVARCNS
jgi:hypothetical protein